MTFAEDLSVFLADFGQACTLAGYSVRAIVDTSAIEDLAAGIVTQGPTALLTSTAAQAAAAVPGSVFTAGGVSYQVRQVLPEPPDAAFTRLVLVRA